MGESEEKCTLATTPAGEKYQALATEQPWKALGQNAAQYASGPAEGSCDYPTEVLSKVFPLSLRTYAPATYELLSAFQLTAGDQMAMLEQALNNKTYGPQQDQLDYREAVCEWVNNNRQEGRFWEHWLPPNYDSTRCFEDCNGHGTCTPIPNIP